jgi:hypothetical protein
VSHTECTLQVPKLNKYSHLDDICEACDSYGSPSLVETLVGLISEGNCKQNAKVIHS